MRARTFWSELVWIAAGKDGLGRSGTGRGQQEGFDGAGKRACRAGSAMPKPESRKTAERSRAALFFMASLYRVDGAGVEKGMS